jgi:hypothetical protein
MLGVKGQIGDVGYPGNDGEKGQKGYAGQKGAPYDPSTLRRPFPGYDGLRGPKVIFSKHFATFQIILTSIFFNFVG